MDILVRLAAMDRTYILSILIPSGWIPFVDMTPDKMINKDLIGTETKIGTSALGRKRMHLPLALGTTELSLTAPSLTRTTSLKTGGTRHSRRKTLAEHS